MQNRGKTLIEAVPQECGTFSYIIYEAIEHLQTTVILNVPRVAVLRL